MSTRKRAWRSVNPSFATAAMRSWDYIRTPPRRDVDRTAGRGYPYAQSRRDNVRIRSLDCRSVGAAVVNRGHFHVAVEMVSVGVEEVDPNIRKMDVPVEVRQVVFEGPSLDFTLRPVGSAVSICVASIALVEPLLVLPFELVIEGDVLHASVAFKKTLDLVQVRLEDLRVMLQLARLHETFVELLTWMVVTRIVLARIVIVFASVRLQQALAALGQEHRHVAPPGHPSGVDEAQFAEVSEFAVPQVQGPIVAVAEVLGWDNSEGTDGRQRATLRTRNVYSRSPSNTRSRSRPRGRSSSRRNTSLGSERSRSRDVAVPRILVALPRIFSGSRIMVEHGRTLAFVETLPHIAACDHFLAAGFQQPPTFASLSCDFGGPTFGPTLR